MEQIESITIDNKHIKILCPSEHWKTEDELLSYCISNFSLRPMYCRQHGEHGGVAIYVQNDLKVKERKDISQVSVTGCFECAGIEFQKMICITVYNNGNSDIMIEKLDALIINKFERENAQVIIVGDFNIDMLKDSNKRTEWLNFLSSHNITQAIFDPTRITRSTSTCIDGIYTNINCHFSTQIIDTHISDHRAQAITISCPKPKQNFIWKRIYSTANINKLKTSLVD